MPNMCNSGINELPPHTRGINLFYTDYRGTHWRDNYPNLIVPNNKQWSVHTSYTHSFIWSCIEDHRNMYQSYTLTAVIIRRLCPITRDNHQVTSFSQVRFQIINSQISQLENNVQCHNIRCSLFYELHLSTLYNISRCAVCTVVRAI